MKLAIHVSGLPHEPGTVYLRLVTTGDEGCVAISAVDEAGETILDDNRWELGSYLLTLTSNGTVALSPAVFPELGFELDHCGRIRLDAYCEAQAAKGANRPALVEN